MDEEQDTLAEQLAGVARELIAAGDVPGTLQRIIDLAVETIEGCDHAGISLVVGDHIETPAQSDEVPARIDRIQLDAGEGPYQDVIREHEVFATGDLAQEQRWRRFASQVVERTGVHSVLALRLFIAEDTLGSLNLYADTVDAFDADDRNVAAIFAAHAAVALSTAQQRQRLHETSQSSDVDVIGKAKGLIMAHQDVDEATALETLRDVANRTNRKLREVADQVVERERER